MSKPSLVTLLVEKEELLNNVAESSDGEITEELKGIINQLDESIEQKIDRVARFLEKLDLEVNYLKLKAEQYTKKAKSLSNLEKKMKEYFTTVVHTHGRPLSGAEFELTLVRNPKSLNVSLSETQMEEMFKAGDKYIKAKTTYAVDKKGVIDELHATPHTLYGTIEQTHRLKIRPARQHLAYDPTSFDRESDVQNTEGDGAPTPQSQG